MKQEKPILIYRIDEKKKSVIYLRCTNNKNLLESISAITLKEISFDELLRDAFDFNKEYPNTLTIAALKAGCTTSFRFTIKITSPNFLCQKIGRCTKKHLNLY